LMPLQHYWPVKDKDKCRSIKHAVDWGNTHEQEVIYNPTPTHHGLHHLIGIVR